MSLNPRRINHLLEATKLHQGLAITNNIKQEKVPSIPFEPRKEETQEKVGPGTYNPNLDSVLKKLPTLTVIKKKQSIRPVPKKALESFISTVFSSPVQASPEGGLARDKSNSSLKKSSVRHGKALFQSKTEQVTPRGESKEEIERSPSSMKATSVFMSKTKRTNPVNEAALGPGVYNPHDISTFGLAKESVFKKKIDFGNQEGRKFSLFRDMASPFKDSTHVENPDSWKY